MRFKLILIITCLPGIFFNYSCKTAKCTSDNGTFIQKYNQQLNMIITEKTGKPPIKIGDDDYRYALTFLSVVSNHEANADYSSTLGYKNLHDYKLDIRTWKKWLSHNKCKMTIAYADSLVNLHVNKR